MRQLTRPDSRIYHTREVRAGGTTLVDLLRDIKEPAEIPAIFERIRWPIGEAERLTRTFMKLDSQTEIRSLRDTLIHLMEWTCLFETDDDDERGECLEVCRNLCRHQQVWIRPVTALRVKPGTRAQHFAALTRHLFLKNEYLGKAGIPAFLDRVWLSADEQGQDVFIKIGAGKDVRTLGVPFSVLTKRMVHEFMTADPSVVLTSEHAIRWAEIHVLGRHRLQSEKRALVEAVLETRLAADFRDEVFWRNVLRFIIRHDLDLAPHRVPEVIDYIWHRRYEAGDTFRLKGRTAASLLRRVDAWHRENHKHTLLPERRWAHVPDISDTRIQFEDKHYLFQQLLSTTDLAAEGSTLRHCVVSYAEDCYQGKTSIWSMTEEVKGKVLTIEVSLPEKRIRQVRGLANRRATDDELAVIRQWAAAEKLHFRIPR